MQIEFPIEFVVEGVPLSHQSGRAPARVEWKERVKTASKTALPEGHWASDGRISATLYYFPVDLMEGDIDNIVKLVLDALVQHIYIDDRQIERIVVQKFEERFPVSFAQPSDILQLALAGPRPALYIRLSDNPLEDLK